MIASVSRIEIFGRVPRAVCAVNLRQSTADNFNRAKHGQAFIESLCYRRVLYSIALTAAWGYM